jgi:hypothetical protein
MFLQEMNFPVDDYVLEVYDAHGNQQDLNFDLSDIDKTFEVKVILPQCNNNSCWSYLTVEYKLPPQLDCPDDMIISCGGLDVLGLPTATAACGGLDFEVSLFNEVREVLDCDPDYTHRIVRTYRATDRNGNFDECTFEILLERVDLTNIMFPESRTLAMGNPISCGDPAYIFNENGIPLPWLFSVITGSGSGFTGSGSAGVPFICDPNITDGVFCPMTGSGSGAPLIPQGGASTITFEGDVVLIPGEVNQVCNSVVLYTDIELPEVGCVKKVMRTWEVREWWCNGENTTGSVQMIEVIDDLAPVFECPMDMTVTTNDDCAANLEMPSVEAVDDCDNGIIVAIDYPRGYLRSNGGLVDLEVGLNTISYIVSDSCYNSSSCSLEVLVRDDTEPVAICEQNTVVSISQSGSTEVYAESFDDGSWDECGLDRFEVRRMDSLCVASDTMFDKSISFCCSDAGQEVMVIFRAYDKGGNHNECMVRVEVQDKDIPLLSCPGDITIDCRDPYDLDNLGLIFGDAEVFDNCAAQQIVNEIVEADVNQCGIGEIVREFELLSLDGARVLRSCKQRIEVENFTPFVASNISWPMDFDTTGTEICDFNIPPQSLPAGFGFPEFISGDDECSLLGWDYEDKVYELTNSINGECAYIDRTWYVINWCSEIDGEYEIFEIPQPQRITITDTEAPEIADKGMDRDVIESFNVDCESGLIEIVREADDNCDSLLWSYVVRNEMDEIVAQGNSNKYRDTLVNGLYEINWVVSDRCGNLDTDVQELEVINLKAPVPVCINSLVVTLTEESVGMDIIYTAELWAEDFDGGSYGPCGNPFTISLSEDPTDQYVEYDCDDVDMPQSVEMWVTDDITGAQDFCMTTIQVTVPDMACGGDQMGNVVVEGDIYTEMLEQVSGVEVDLEGGEMSDITSTDGHYAFSDMPMGGDYVVRPEKDGDDLNGVSTLDLILIQRHILGIEQLQSPYKLIAADIDRNNKISATDLIELRKLVLGIYEEFPENTSWRFVDAETQFLDPNDPWAFKIPEVYEILGLNADMTIDFVGVKVGDVNDSVEASDASTANENDISKALEFELTYSSASRNELSKIDFKAKDYDQIAGWQGTLQFDPEKIEVQGVYSTLLELDQDLHTHVSNREGWIAISYSTAMEESINDNEVLFSIEYLAKEDIDTRSLFSFSNKVTNSEAYGKGLKTMPVKISSDISLLAEITGVKPNPWVDNAELTFTLSKQSEVQFDFYDVNGRLLYTINDNYDAGMQSLRLNKNKLGASGIIYVRMTTSFAHSEYKMVLLN